MRPDERIKPVRCAFWGGPWADQVFMQPSEMAFIRVPLPVQDPIAFLVEGQRYETLTSAQIMPTFEYQLERVSDDGTRHYYPAPAMRGKREAA